MIKKLKFKKLKSKKGDLPSLIIMIFIVFALAVGGILFSIVSNEIFSGMKEIPEINQSSNAVEAIDAVNNGATGWLDFLFFFSLIALSIGLIISSIYIDVSPAITMIFAILWILAIFIAGIMSNVFAEITGETEIAQMTEQFTLTKTVMPIMPFVIFGIGIIVIAVLYGKPHAGTGGI